VKAIENRVLALDSAVIRVAVGADGFAGFADS
jgi:hypothetical protein